MAPSKGKPVSGPGRLSARTDLSPSNPNNRKIQGAKEIRSSEYGEGKELQALQTGAPMKGNPAPVPNIPIAPLNGPSMRPDEPAEAGMPFGSGAGPESLMLPSAQPVIPQELTTIAKYFNALDNMARAKEAPESFKVFMQAVRSQLGGLGQ
jgi:hypothetical protein